MGAGTEAIYLLSQPYYALHAIAFFSYFIARHAATTSSSDLFRHHLFHRELQTTLSLCVLLCLKWRKSSTLEAFLGDGLLYGKGVLLLLSAILDLRLAAWYFISFVAIFLLFQQPSFKGLGNVIHMTPVQLENHLSEGNSEKIWLIEFRAVWSPECIRSGRVFINLSARYSTGNLYFGSVDVGRFPKAAEVYDLSLGVNKGELPTYIMFKGGSEVSRLSKAGSLSESVIATYFELDRHLVFDLDKNYVGGRQTSTS